MTEHVEQAAPEVPDFDLLRPIGSGGYGQVWLAKNRTTGNLRAVKVISLQSEGKGDRSNLCEAGHRPEVGRGAFRQIGPVPFSPAAREISSLVRLEANLRCQHPNLLYIHHVGKTAQHLFYVMDLADDALGGPASERPEYRPATLQSRLEMAASGNSPTAPAGWGSEPANATDAADVAAVPFPPEVCLDYARQLLAGLAALHAAGMVHRDVKPANCLFVDGQLKLADFGLLTQSHPLVSRLGTQRYMPPDGRMDMRADVYAAGLVIYEMLTGLPVDQFPRLGPRAREIGDSPALMALLQMVLRACEREPEARFADARAMLAELDDLQTTATRRPTRRLVLLAGVAGFLATVGFAAWTLFPQPAAVELVDVSFVTVPYYYEAKICVDGELLTQGDGTPYTTPCTVEGLAAGPHRVEFERNGRRWNADPRDAPIDFARTRQIVSKLPK